MSDKNKNNEEKVIFIEGTEIKGGINSHPSTPRPSQPPKGQSSQQQTQSQKN